MAGEGLPGKERKTAYVAAPGELRSSVDIAFGFQKSGELHCCGGQGLLQYTPSWIPGAGIATVVDLPRSPRRLTWREMDGVWRTLPVGTGHHLSSGRVASSAIVQLRRPPRLSTENLALI